MAQLAKLSGSFAASGLVAHALLGSTSITAHAYFNPVYVPLMELPYPVRRPSGKVVKDFRAKELGEKDVVSARLLQDPSAVPGMGYAILGMRSWLCGSIADDDDGLVAQAYPLDDLLKSPWAAFRADAMLLAVLKG